MIAKPIAPSNIYTSSIIITIVNFTYIVAGLNDILFSTVHLLQILYL
jgi:hypothetical protein